MLLLSSIWASSLRGTCPSVIPDTPVWPVSCLQTPYKKENEQRHPDKLTRHSFSPLLSLSICLSLFPPTHFYIFSLPLCSLTHSVLLTFLRQIHYFLLSFSLSLSCLNWFTLLSAASLKSLLYSQSTFCSSPLLYAPWRSVVGCIIRDESVVQLFSWW